MAVLAIAAFVLYALLVVRSPCARLVDLAWLPSPAEIHALLDACGPTGRDLYRNEFLPVDVGFALLWALSVAAVIAWARPTARWLLLLPLSTLLLDWVEGVGLWMLLAEFPTPLPRLATVLSGVTAAKLVLGGASVGAAALVLVGVALRRVRTRRQPT